MTDSRSPPGSRLSVTYATDLGVLGILQVVSRLRGLILLPVIVNSMGTASYGVWTQSLVVVIVGSAVIGFQLPAALVRFVSGTSSQIRQRQTFIPMLLILALISTLVSILVASAPMLAARIMFGDVGYASVGRWIGLWIGFETILGLGLDLQRGRHRLKLYGVLKTGVVLLQMVLIVAVVTTTKNLETAVISAVALNGIAAVVVVAAGLKEIGISWPGFGGLRPCIEFSVPLVPSYYGAVVLSHADRMAIAWILGPEAVGVYAAAYSLARMVGEVFVPIKSTLLPTASRVWDSGAASKGRQLLEETLHYYSLLAIPALVGATLVGPQLIAVLASQIRVPTLGWIVMFLGLGFLLNNLQSIIAILFQLRRNTRPLGVSKVISSLAYVAIVTVAVTGWGILGGAVATAFGYVLDLAITSHFARQVGRLPIPWTSILKAGLASTGMAVLVLLTLSGRPVSLAIAIASGVVSYSVFLLLLRGVGRREWRFLRSILRPAPSKNIDN